MNLPIQRAIRPTATVTNRLDTGRKRKEKRGRRRPCSQKAGRVAKLMNQEHWRQRAQAKRGREGRRGGRTEHTDENDAKDDNDTSVSSSPVAALRNLVHNDARVGNGLDGGHCVGERGEKSLCRLRQKRR